MPSLLRLTAFLPGLLLLQLTLLGVESPCSSHVRSADRAHVATSGATGMSHDASSTRAPSDACDAEQTAGECATMPSCAAALSLPVGLVVVVALAAAGGALAEPASIHSQPATGPDVPPPRG